MFEYKFGNTIFKRYNKKYTTPEVFNSYKINLLAIIAGIVSALFTFLFEDVYVCNIFCDILFACSYVFMTTIVKCLYQNGILNTVVDRTGVWSKLANAFAIFTQVAFWRIFVTIPFFAMSWGINIFHVYNASWIFSLIIVIMGWLITFGIFSRYKVYNRTMQKAYSAVIDGPVSMNEDVRPMIETHAVTIAKLDHPELATQSFYNCQNSFLNSARNVKNISNDYDNEWRKCIIYSHYQYCKNMPEHTRLFLQLETALEEHEQNAIKLNNVILSENDKCSILPKKATTAPMNNIKIVRADISKKTKQSDDDSSAKTTKSLWDKDVNWY